MHQQWMLGHKAWSGFAQERRLINQVDTFIRNTLVRTNLTARTITSTYVSVPKEVRKARQ